MFIPVLPPSLFCAAGGDGGALGIVSAGVMKFTNCAFYDNYCQYGSGGASERELHGQRPGRSTACCRRCREASVGTAGLREMARTAVLQS